ncbi:Extracellular sulfatase Sulf-1, partial [Tyrophagus putrescentiae]
TNGENCSSPQWQKTYESQSFGKYLHDSGYRTAFFGKYLNEYNGSYIPAGWSHFSGLIRNSRYYSYQLNVNGDRVRHGSDYHLDYYPDLILNDSLQYMRYSNRFFSSKPYLMVMSFPSPHGPEDAAPQFQKMFFNEKGHRTPSWNHAPNGDKQWLLRKTPKMARIHQDFTDFLNTKRLQTLQSVDNAVYQIYSELKNLGELENTYIIYTSDHGYHLGQFGLVKGKAMPFEFDIRVPFFVRGPGVPHDQTLPQIVLNIDIAPTLLDIAGVKIPSHMDGISFLPYLKQLNNTLSKQKSKLESRSKRQERVDKKLIYRDSFLIEKGKFKVPVSVDKLLIPIIGKKQWLQLECQKPEYSSPCKMYQKFECFTDRNGAYRIRKCSRSHRGRKHQCICPNGTASLKNFGNEVNNQHDGSFQWQRQRETRLKRSDDSLWTSSFFSMFRDEPGMHSARENVNNFDVAGVYDLKKLVDLAKSTAPTSRNAQEDRNLNVNRVTVNSSLNDISNITTSQLISILQTEELTDMSNYTDYLNRTFCTVARTNLSIECTEEIYHNQESWKEKKNHIDAAIKELQRRLFELKGIRRFMNEKRPIKAPSSGRKSKKCHCDPTAGGVSQFSQRMQVHPRRQVERRFMKHLVRKKWSRRHEKKMRKKEKFENTACKADANEQMNCFTHGPDHWKTAPFWTQAPFCFCQNAQNNSFECLRTINETHNSLYCEFVTGFIAYFDLLKDPFQLKNAIYELEFSTIEELSRNLAHLKGCSGAEQCTLPRQQTPKRRSSETDSSVYSKTLNGTNAQLS